MVEIERLLAVADIARQAGVLILGADRAAIALKPMSDGADPSPVTQADLEAERLIAERIGAVFPGVAMVAEEAVSAGNTPASQSEMLFIDPLDGTKEFLGGHPDYTVNIALVRDGRPVLGVVHAPARAETYIGAEGLAAASC